MKAKICYMNEIHRVSKVPETLESFNQLVVSIFKDRLPALWSLQYVDSDGDNIILADNKDFEEFQKFGSSGATGASVIKVFVKAVNGMEVSQMKSEQEEDYQIIGAPQMEESQKIEKSIEEAPKVEESIQVEVPKVEESVQAEVEPPKAEEDEGEDPRVDKQEDEEEDPRVEKEDEPMAEAQKAEEKVEEPVAAVEEKAEEKVEEKAEEEPEPEEEKKEEEISDILNNSARSIEFIGDKKVLVELDILEQLMGSALEKSLPKFIQKTTEELSKKEKEKEKEKEEVPVNPWAVEKKKVVNKVIHYGVRCNGCYTNPIIGFRYKCTICPDFDYCEECEGTKDHPHDFIKMKKHTFNNEKKVSFANPSSGILKRREVPKKKPEEDEVQLIKGPENDYFKALKDKAEKMHKCFPKVEFEILLAYVNGAPDDMSLEELIENYKH